MYIKDTIPVVAKEELWTVLKMGGILLRLLFAVLCFLPLGKTEGPSLNVTENHIDVSVGSTLYLKCNGTHPLAWKFRYSVNQQESSLEELTSFRASLFESIIHLEFNNYAMTGRYICFYNNVSDSDSASIYIFVNSVGQLLLPVEGYPFEVVFIHDAKIIPCLPTNSSAEVSLRKSAAEVSLQKSTASAIDLNSGVDFCANTMALEKNLPYDPTEGFQISNSTSYYRGPFCCEATLGGFKESIVFIFGNQSTKLTATIVRQEIGYFVVNSPFSFACFLIQQDVMTQTTLLYGWSYPAAAAKRIRIEEIPENFNLAASAGLIEHKMNPVSLKELTLDSAQKSDGGFFRCSVMTPSYEVYSTEVFVRIYDVEEYPYLKPEGASVEFKANYRTFPSFPNFWWLKKSAIIFEKPGKYEIFQKDGSCILRVHNVSADDSGTYTFLFSNGATSSKMHFRFSVLPGTPNIYQGMVYKPDFRDITLFCNRQYNEWSLLEWIWRPPCDDACDTSVKPEIIFKGNPNSENVGRGISSLVPTKGIVLTVKSIINVPGDYFCRGTNEFGSTEELVFYRNTTLNLSPQDFPPVLKVNQTEELTLSCVANKSLYKNVEIWRKLASHGSFEKVNGSVVSVKMESLLKTNYPFGVINYGDTGIYRCSATYRENISRVNEKSVFIFVSGSRKRFIYFTNMDAEEVLGYINETFKLFCYISGEISLRTEWNFMRKPLSLDIPGIMLVDFDQKLIFEHLEKQHEGYYECRASNQHYTDLRRTKLLVKTYPRIWKTNMNSSTVVADPLEYLDLFCYVDDLRGTTITWHLNNRTIDENVQRVQIDDHFQKLHIKGLTEESSGVYECRAENKVGYASASMTLLIKKAPERTDNSGIIGFTFSGVLLFLILSAFFLLFLTRRYRRRKNIARKALLIKEETSSDEDIFDYEVSPEDTMLFNQVLPNSEELATAYDKKLEFPKHRLQFGKSVGSGEFGRVVKAKAIGINDFEPTTTVAVKMAKDKGNPMHEAALMKELKILLLLGYHLNIMSLLGAVTRSPKGLLIIVEYCRHGNLRRYLHKQRSTFVPQGTDISENAEEEKQMESLRQSTELQDEEKYSIALEQFSWDTAELPDEMITEKSHSTRNSGCISEPVKACSENNAGSCRVTASDSSESISAKKCRKRRSRKRRLCFSDLISYAFQCARGMSYLASKKLIHRDLAARNILLSEGNVIKLCDFGLTKDIYSYPNYMPSKDTPLPFKWMAIESLADGVFTTKSDVWSFGVVLWELFSLGMHPYPGIPTDEQFYGRLKNGYRMDKPEFATDDIYQIMSSCWKENPAERPNFLNLTETLGDRLDDAVREHYVNMNEPYARRNELAAMSHLEESGEHTPLENFADIKMENSVGNHCDISEIPVNNQGDVETTSGEHTPLENFAGIKMENSVGNLCHTSEVSVNNQGDVEIKSEVSSQAQSYSP